MDKNLEQYQVDFPWCFFPTRNIYNENSPQIKSSYYLSVIPFISSLFVIHSAIFLIRMSQSSKSKSLGN